MKGSIAQQREAAAAAGETTGKNSRSHAGTWRRFPHIIGFIFSDKTAQRGSRDFDPLVASNPLCRASLGSLPPSDPCQPTRAPAPTSHPLAPSPLHYAHLTLPHPPPSPCWPLCPRPLSLTFTEQRQFRESYCRPSRCYTLLHLEAHPHLPCASRGITKRRRCGATPSSGGDEICPRVPCRCAPLSWGSVCPITRGVFV